MEIEFKCKTCQEWKHEEQWEEITADKLECQPFDLTSIRDSRAGNGSAFFYCPNCASENFTNQMEQSNPAEKEMIRELVQESVGLLKEVHNRLADLPSWFFEQLAQLSSQELEEQLDADVGEINPQCAMTFCIRVLRTSLRDAFDQSGEEERE